MVTANIVSLSLVLMWSFLCCCRFLGLAGNDDIQAVIELELYMAHHINGVSIRVRNNLLSTWSMFPRLNLGIIGTETNHRVRVATLFT